MKSIKIIKIKKTNVTRHVYDLSVNENHNFFIGKTETLTSNCDGLTFEAQASLRPIMEVYALRTRFILTGNYHERIIEPIMSRCQSFELTSPPKRDVAVHLCNILKSENITYKNEDLAAVVNSYYPDIRKVIQVCQQYSLDGTLKLAQTELVSENIRNTILNFLVKKSSFAELRKFVIEQDLKKFGEIYDYLYENLDKFSDGKIASVILKLADGIKDDSMSVNKQITFLATMINLLGVLKSN